MYRYSFFSFKSNIYLHFIYFGLQKESATASANGSKTTINLTSNDAKAIKIGTTTNTPVKTGFHLVTNSAKKEKGSPNVSEQRRRSEAQLKNDFSSLGKLKPNNSFTALSSMSDSVDKSGTSTPAKSGKNQVDFKVSFSLSLIWRVVPKTQFLTK